MGKPFTCFLKPFQKMADGRDGPCPQDEVHVVESGQQFLSELLGNTTGHDDLEVRTACLKPSETSQKGMDLLFRFFSDGARVEEYDVRGLDIRGGDAPVWGQNTLHPEGIVFVHLATESLDVQILRFDWHFQERLHCRFH